MTQVHVEDADAFEPGAKRIIETDRGSVGVFNIDNEYFAILDTCAHQGGPLCEGTVLNHVTAEFNGVGQRVTEKFTDENVVKCPWHGWEYHLDSGDLAGDNKISLPTFDVIEENGDIFVEI
jgi:nitrite reductase/ring-hydroxylating ferredoxin subunit